MATYKDIQGYVKNKYGISVKTCWIAHAKEILGLYPKIASNRYDRNSRTNPCPAEKLPLITNAFKYFGMI
jgi:hypothetical protein